MARAMISLPVPVSPKSSTGALLRETIRARTITAASPVSAANQPLVRRASRLAGDQMLGQRNAAGRLTRPIFCDIY